MRTIFLMGLAGILLLPIVLAGEAAIAGYVQRDHDQLVFLLIWVIAASVFATARVRPGFFGFVQLLVIGSLGGAVQLGVRAAPHHGQRASSCSRPPCSRWRYAAVFTGPMRTRSIPSLRSSTRRPSRRSARR